jgi:hypothetical protein
MRSLENFTTRSNNVRNLNSPPPSSALCALNHRNIFIAFFAPSAGSICHWGTERVRRALSSRDNWAARPQQGGWPPIRDDVQKPRKQRFVLKGSTLYRFFVFNATIWPRYYMLRISVSVIAAGAAPVRPPPLIIRAPWAAGNEIASWTVPHVCIGELESVKRPARGKVLNWVNRIGAHLSRKRTLIFV